MPELPDFLPPVTPGDTLNQQAPLASVLSTDLAGGSPIPVAYGNVQIGGTIFAASFTGGFWYVGAYFCVGEIEAIDNIYLNGAAPVAGVTYNTYTGTTSQTADALLAAGITGYTDTLVEAHPSGNIGIAYVALKYSDSHYSGFPKIVAELRGRKVYNPATSTTAYSRNPALALRDFIVDARFGLGDSVDDTSLQALQTDNDATVTTEARRQVDVVCSGTRPASSWVKTLEAYAGGWALRRGDKWYFASDRPGTSVATFTTANIVARSLKVTVVGREQKPTRVRVIYSDTGPTIWRERDDPKAELSGVSSGTVPLRESVIRLAGITRYSQAVREATERLNKLQHGLSISFVARDDHLGIELGDIITVTHAYGFASQLFRVTKPPTRVGLGRIKIDATTYAAGDYSDVEPATPTYGDSSERVGTDNDVTDISNQYQEWDDILNVPAGITGIAYQSTAPSSPNTGDFWIDSDDDKQYRWSGSAWVQVQDDDIAQALSNAATAQSTADGKVFVFYSASAPVADATGDLWVDSNDTNKLYRWSGSSWVAVYDTRIATALSDASNAQATADGKIVTFVQTSAPTAQATGDLWIDSDDNNKLYRWSGSSWVSVQDGDITQAQADASTGIANAATAQATADGKVVTFVQTSAPTAEGVGDLWMDTNDNNKMYRWSGSSWVAYTQDAATWSKVSGSGKPADNATVGADWNSNLTNIPSALATIFFQSSAPGGASTGDFWIDSDDDSQYRWNGSSWVQIQDDDIGQALSNAATAQSTADGKVFVFAQTSAPTADATGDLWLDTNDTNKLYRWSGSSWVAVYDTRIATALSDASNAQATADGKIVTFAQTSAPTAEGVGDIWVDTDDNNKLYRWSGSSWVSVQDGDITQAQADATTAIANAATAQSTANTAQSSASTAQSTANTAQSTANTAQSTANTAQSTANSKIITFVQTSAPSAQAAGDLWMDTNDNNKMYRWSGSSWVAYTQDAATWSKVSGSGRPADNATNNTGNLADLNTVDTPEIEDDAVTSFSTTKLGSSITWGTGANMLILTHTFTGDGSVGEALATWVAGGPGSGSLLKEIRHNDNFLANTSTAGTGVLVAQITTTVGTNTIKLYMDPGASQTVIAAAAYIRTLLRRK